MTMTKVLGAGCGALLVFLLGNFAAEMLYETGGGHGEGEHAAGYVIEVASNDAAATDAAEGPSFAELLASADVGKGAKAFGKCKACHKLEDGANSTGPSLYDVVNRTVGTEEGFAYSGALVAVAQTWSPENLDQFLENPKGFAPGTKMSFSGLKKPEDRANLIAYLDTLDD
ncbi:cytochrome c family protein [Litorivita sp. NS0012-18]|uniref:c-type cytochrome n=1 Tax=Litorivita sp. NS0012-18 TaxID=3127655 RepID=UPI003342B4D2